MIKIQYQTSALQPAPFAYALEIDLKSTEKGLEYTLDLEYLDRDSLTEEEILEEGFTMDDDLHLKGELPVVWREEIKFLLKKTQKTNKEELEENEDLWLLHTEDGVFYPKNHNNWAETTEQLRQAIVEASGLEKPLEITLLENGEKTVYVGSFAKKTLVVDRKGEKKGLRWSDLNALLRDLFSGDLLYEEASTKEPKGKGIYLNVGDEYWFELGKSYINKLQKVKNWL
jgi:hypothetical protein